jgi:hypothetical protein
MPRSSPTCAAVPLQLDVLAEGEQSGRDDVGPDEGLDQAGRVSARIVGMEHASGSFVQSR